jgi:hypothetical protein
MSQQRIEIGEVRMSFVNGEDQEQRTEHISRLTFEHVLRLMGGRISGLSRLAHVNYLSVGPIHVSFDAMDDEAIARASAAEIYRALLQAI